jgi:hypothetical protein
MEFVEKQLDGNLLVDLLETTNNNKKETKESKKTVNKSLNLQEKLNNAFRIRGPSCGLIVIDNFYNNAQSTRDFILTQNFSVRGNFPGQRTISYANEHLKAIIQAYVSPFGGRITEFPIPDLKDDKKNNKNEIYNGSFQYTTSIERSWVHTDSWNNWAGVVYLTPDAPLSAGTAFYRFKNGEYSEEDAKILNTKDQTDKCSQDLTKWELVDKVGNVFNRLILFDSKRFHMSMDYFGDTKENGRLFQVFFFSTER